MSENQITLKKILALLDQCNINYQPTKKQRGLFSSICFIDKGILYINQEIINCIYDPTDLDICAIIHELSHLLSIPIEFRKTCTPKLHRVAKIYISEMATRLMSISISNYLNISIKKTITIFSDGGTADRSHIPQTFFLQATAQFDKEKYYQKKQCHISIFELI